MINKSCPSCKNKSPSSYDNCLFCKFPFNGSEDEKSKHIGKFITEKRILDESEENIVKSRNLLFMVVGLNVFALFINQFDTLSLIITILISAIILACAIFFRKNPVILTIIPLSIILFFYIINFLVEPESLFKGILFKLLIVGGLSYNLYTLNSAKKFKKENNLI